MEPYAAERKVRLCMDAVDSLQPCWDGEAVIQALVNLLDNAIKHSPAGGMVRVGSSIAASRVRLWVEDEGPGIPAAARDNIFDAFHREGAELRRETAGAGLGLSIVKHIAEAHGGRVFVESAPGRGARFVLELPMRRPA